MAHIDQEYQKLKTGMSEMIAMVQKQMSKAVSALFDFDKELANNVLFNEKRVNAFEVKIDKDCEVFLALFSPVASDLRFVFSTLKINYNIERIGDNAARIAKYIIQSEEQLDKDLVSDLCLHKMVSTMQSMLSDVATAYGTDDTKLAREILEKDEVLNDIYKDANSIIVDYIQKNPDKAFDALHLHTLIGKIERVGDHITNMAEEIIFYVEAKVLRHGKKDL